MTRLYPDRCDHGIETYIGTMYNKDIYLLPNQKVICIRYGETDNRYQSIDISSIPNILHHGGTCCYPLVNLIRTIVQ